MHQEITVVIPGAVNTKQVQMNSDVSDLEEIDYLYQKINNIYVDYIKNDVHDKWG